MEARIKMADVMLAVAKFYGLTLDELKHRSCAYKYVRPRQIVAYLCSFLTKNSLPDIGRRLGGFDHSTVLYGRNRIRDLIETDPRIKSEVAEIERILRLTPPQIISFEERPAP